MKVLYVLYQPDALSEAYARVEREWMERQGVEVAIWSRRRAASPYPLGDRDVTIGGRLAETIARFRPDVIHVHWLMIGAMAVEVARQAGVPMTVRGHSFDHRADAVSMLEHASVVERIWLFPHLVEDWMSEKVSPLPVAFEPRLFRPGGKRDPGLVFRTSAGVGGKSVEEFLEIASRLPDHRFVLAVTRDVHNQDYTETLGREVGSNVEVKVGIPYEECAEIMRRCGVYLRSHDPLGHPYGMPISIAEAMGSGALVVVRRHPVADKYVGEAGRGYDRVDEAVEIIKQTKMWTGSEWEKVSKTSVERSKAFHSDLILPAVLEEWEKIRAESKGD